MVAGISFMSLFGPAGQVGRAVARLLGPAAPRLVGSRTGLILAGLYVTLPFAVRTEAAHVLGATRWQPSQRVVFPAIRASVLYGVVLCTARAAGEFGAVSVVSGELIGETNTLTLHIERAYAEDETVPAFAAATLLTTVGLLTVAVDTLWRRRRHA